MFDSSMFDWIYGYPTFVVGAVIGIFFVGLTWLGILIFRPVVGAGFMASEASTI
jgi:hypothetical protein